MKVSIIWAPRKVLKSTLSIHLLPLGKDLRLLWADWALSIIVTKGALWCHFGTMSQSITLNAVNN